MGRMFVGSLVGATLFDVHISKSFSTGNVSGSYNEIGGLVGFSNVQNDINASYSESNVTGASEVGGIIGLIGYMGIGNASISDAYSTGYVKGADDVGGIAGMTGYSMITRVYSTGTVECTSSANNAGGIIGEGWYPVYLSASFSTSKIIKPRGQGFSAAGILHRQNVPGIDYFGEPIMSYNPPLPPSNFFWYDDPSDNAVNCWYTDYSGSPGNTGCTKITDSNIGLPYFYNKMDQPMGSWDFTNIWQEHPDTYPTLR
jgi:hypothetical protein